MKMSQSVTNELNGSKSHLQQVSTPIDNFHNYRSGLTEPSKCTAEM